MPLAAASRAVVQGSDKGMYEECRMLYSNPHAVLEIQVNQRAYPTMPSIDTGTMAILTAWCSRVSRYKRSDQN